MRTGISGNFIPALWEMEMTTVKKRIMMRYEV
jgi:hypothetical protein